MTDQKQPRRGEILDQVKKTICHDRQIQHGAPEDTFAEIADEWTAQLLRWGKMPEGLELSPSDVAKLMEIFKECRWRANPDNIDNLHDKIGYAAIYVELREREKAQEQPFGETVTLETLAPAILNVELPLEPDELPQPWTKSRFV